MQQLPLRTIVVDHVHHREAAGEARRRAASSNVRPLRARRVVGWCSWPTREHWQRKERMLTALTVDQRLALCSELSYSCSVRANVGYLGAAGSG